MQIVVRSLGVGASTISLIGVNEEPPATPVGSCYGMLEIKHILFMHQIKSKFICPSGLTGVN